MNASPDSADQTCASAPPSEFLAEPELDAQELDAKELDAQELDVIEDELERVERTLGLLADDDVDPAAAAAWIGTTASS